MNKRAETWSTSLKGSKRRQSHWLSYPQGNAQHLTILFYCNFSLVYENITIVNRYGESRWCLDELRTIMEQAEREELVVIPIFYKVRPEEVRKQKGEFGQKFWRLTEEYSCEKIEKWQASLKAVSNKIGFTLEHNRYIYINSFLFFFFSFLFI